MSRRVAGASKRNAATDPPQAGDPYPQTQQLLDLTRAAGVELSHDETRTAFVRFPIGDHWESWPLRSTRFVGWLRLQFYSEFAKVPMPQAMTAVRDQLEAEAQFHGPLRPTYVRVAEADGRFYVDLGTESWSAIEVSQEGWRVIDRPPVLFCRGPATCALPIPRRGGRIESLRDFVRVADGDWPLICAWLIACLRPTGSVPILVLQGEQGSAKSTTARFLRALADPSAAPLRSAPKDERDLMIAAETNWVISLDNLSRVPSWLSDCLCRMVTGGATATRALFSDRGETIFRARRPIIINGIDELAEQYDLRDRALILRLPPLADRDRRDEGTLVAAFEAVLPEILGALLDAVSEGLHRLPLTSLEQSPRLADFARWAVACEAALGLAAGSFLRAYFGNRHDAVALSVAFDSVAQALLQLVEGRPWSGTPTELLQHLSTRVPDSVRDSTDWPRTPRALSNRIDRLAAALRASGVDVSRWRESSRRVIDIRRGAGIGPARQERHDCHDEAAA